MIEVYSQNVTVASGSAIPFNVIALELGCSTRQNDATRVNLLKPGVYKVELNADVVASEVDDVSVQLTKNGVAIPQAVASATPASITAVSHLSIVTLVRVREGCCGSTATFISVLNTGVDATFNNVNLVVTKE